MRWVPVKAHAPLWGAVTFDLGHVLKIQDAHLTKRAGARYDANTCD